MAEAFITRRGGGGKRLYIPRYSGTMNVVYTEDGTGGYAEFTTSGRLSWEFNAPPKRVDLFCVGGGGGTTYVTHGPTGSGAGGGYTSTLLGVSLPAQIDIAIGAGGAAGQGMGAGGNGGTTSIGTLIQALGGGKGSGNGRGGNGGSGGGGGCSTSGYLSQGGDGGSNGGNGATARGDSTNYAGGAGQGTPTTDLLGRVHAGGGAGGNTSRGATVTPGIGGASDFIAGSGQSSSYPNSGGGGYGGGAAGAYNASYTGGQGFAMIGWGDYTADTPVDYIKGDGSAYIKTGIMGSEDLEVEVGLIPYNTDTNQMIFGIDVSNTHFVVSFYGGTLNAQAKGSYVSTDMSQLTDGINILELTQSVFTVNGTEYQIGGTQPTYTTELYLFSAPGASPGMLSTCALTYCKVWQGGELVRDFVPIRRGLAGAYAMKDQLTETVYSNAGGGAFTGP